MIISCKSCEKKFVVPDQAITSDGRIVQCGSCGNKWKQLPINEINKNEQNSNVKKMRSKTKKVKTIIQNTKKIKKTTTKNTREIHLYSPEYLAKKHGIKLNNTNFDKISYKSDTKDKISFGFYNSLLFFLITIIVLSRGLYFFQELIVQKLPFTEFYINYYFESVNNLFEIWKSLISNY